MREFWTIIICGLLALAFFICSAMLAKRGKFALGLGFGALELLCAAVSCCFWAWALKNSGKGDWYIFGLFGYPLGGLIFWSMLIAGVVCAAANIRGLAEKETA